MGKMRYERQAIILLDPDLENNAALLQVKRELAEEHAKSSVHRGKQLSTLLHPPLEILPSNSRIVVIAHGDSETSQCIYPEGTAWDG
jgi:hypothetical protein